MTEIFPLLLLVLLFLALMMFSRRNKRRAAMADSLRRERITAGTEVMTTSGLYGTVVSMSEDGTVLLSVAPGVEVRWQIAALREVSELPEQYREPIVGAGGQQGGSTDADVTGRPSLKKESRRTPRADDASPS